jgi:hypothetical protein
MSGYHPYDDEYYPDDGDYYQPAQRGDRSTYLTVPKDDRHHWTRTTDRSRSEGHQRPYRPRYTTGVSGTHRSHSQTTLPFLNPDQRDYDTDGYDTYRPGDAYGRPPLQSKAFDDLSGVFGDMSLGGDASSPYDHFNVEDDLGEEVHPRGRQASYLDSDRFHRDEDYDSRYLVADPPYLQSVLIGPNRMNTIYMNSGR